MGRPAIVMIGDMPEPVGGVAEWCYQVCAGLQRDGVDVHFIDTSPHPVKHPSPGLASYQLVRARNMRSLPIAHSGSVVRAWARHMPGLVRPVRPKAAINSLLLALRLAEQVRRSGARTIVAHHAEQRGLAAVIAARATGARATVVVHGAEFARLKSVRTPATATLVARAADRIITPSEHSRRLCRAAAGDVPVDVILNGIDHDRFHPNGPALERWPGELVVLFLGHMHPRKGPDVLARAIPLIQANRRVRFLFAGPDFGSERLVRDLVAAASIGHCTEFLGTVPAEELPALYRRADVFTFPTVRETEGFGLVAAEAMACGTPVVASRIGAIPEVVADGRAGLLVPPNDPGQLAAALRTLLEDDDERRKMGAAAAVHAQQFEWSAVVQALGSDVRQGLAR